MAGTTKYPASVQRQLDQANELEKQLTAPPVTTEEPPVDAVPDTTVDVPAPVVTPPAPMEPWEQRYKSLQGQFNSMVPQLQGEIKVLSQRLQQAMDELAATKAKPVEITPKVTDKDVEVFGAELVDMSRRAAQEAAEATIAQQRAYYEPVIEKLNQRIADMQSQLGNVNETVAQNATDRYYADLVKQVPDWEALNTDARFLAWLAEVDPMYGEPRQNALDRSYQILDASRTAAVFKAYRATLDVVAPRANPRDELSAQVSPSRAATQPQQQAPQGRSFSGRDIEQFYENKRRGRYTPEVAHQLETEINDAIVHGRITP